MTDIVVPGIGFGPSLPSGSGVGRPLSDLREAVRTVTRDNQGDFIQDTDIDLWLNEGQRDIAARIRGLQQIATGTVDIGSVITLPSDLLSIHSLRLTGQVPAQFADDDKWATWSDSGNFPSVALYRIFGDAIYVYPDATGTDYTLEYAYLPPDLSAPEDTSLLPVILQAKLLHYARAQALYKVGDTTEGDRYVSMYEDGLPQTSVGKVKQIPGPLTLTFRRGPFDTTDAVHW